MAQDTKAMTIPFWQWNQPIPLKEGEKDLRLYKAEQEIENIKKLAPILECKNCTYSYQ